MLLLAFHVSVEQGHISLTAAPEHVALAAQSDGCVHGVLDLQHSVCSSVKIRVGRGTVHIARVSEHVCSAPEQLDAGLGLFLLRIFHDFLEVGLIFFRSIGLVNEVNIVEAVVLDAHFLHELEACVHLGLCAGDRIGGSVPRELLRAHTELVGTIGSESVPPCHREREPFFHLAAGYHSFRFIIVKCHRILGILALKRDFPDSREIV